MGQQATVKAWERAASMVVVLALHAAAFLLFLTSRTPAPDPRPEPARLAAFSIAADASARTVPPPPRLPSKAVTEAPLLKSATFNIGSDSDAQGAAAAQCAALDIIGQALVADPAAVTSVMNAPPESRSIAEAVIMWNSGWSPAAMTPDAPLGAARTSVERSLAAMDQRCLDEPIAGPRFVPVPVGTATMFLVFGSGEWKWRQLTERPVSTDTPELPGRAGP